MYLAFILFTTPQGLTNHQSAIKRQINFEDLVNYKVNKYFVFYLPIFCVFFLATKHAVFI